jgi:translation elongation factor EF-Ts
MNPPHTHNSTYYYVHTYYHTYVHTEHRIGVVVAVRDNRNRARDRPIMYSVFFY